MAASLFSVLPFRIASDTHCDFAQLLASAAVKPLDFVATPWRLVVLDSEGQRFP